MDLFTQLTQQALSVPTAQITPRLPARFEQAHAPEYAAADMQDVHEQDVYAAPTPTRYLAPLDASLRSDMSGVRSDMSGVRSDMSGVRSDMSGVRSNMPGVRSDMSGVRSDMSGDVSKVQAPAVQHEEPQITQAKNVVGPGSTQQSPPQAIQPVLARREEMPSAAAPQQPAIHVSIGRIEVRAISRPAEPQRRAPEQPRAATQSLDDYLRNGGRKR